MYFLKKTKKQKGHKKKAKKCVEQSIIVIPFKEDHEFPNNKKDWDIGLTKKEKDSSTKIVPRNWRIAF